VKSMYIEVGALASGERTFRMRCDGCGRVGLWQTQLHIAENTLRIHQKHIHEKAAA
jgi:hypothetical protein